MMAGKNKDYLISSSLSFDDILKDISLCSRSYYLIGVSTDRIGSPTTSEDTSYAMALIIDTKEKTIEVFDPNGITPNTRHVYFWTTQLIAFLLENDIFVERKITADEPFCGVSSFSAEFRGEQQCLVWVYWYIWLNIHNPNVNSKDIRSYLMRFTPDDGFDRVRRIASSVFIS